MKHDHFPILALALLAVALTGACEPTTNSYNWDGITYDTVDDGILPDYLGDSTPWDSYDPVDAWGLDNDGDGFSPATGDCNDAEAAVNPNAYDDPENLVDDNCDGIVDNPMRDCDCGVMPTMIEGMELCDPRFVTAVEDVYYAPYANQGRGVRPHYGNPGNDLNTRYGCSYSMLSTGALDPSVDVCANRQPGTDFYDPTGPGMCSGTEPDPDPRHIDSAPYICDTEQLVIHFHAPSNALGFSFDFLYASTEYPEWVEMGYNDTFYAIFQGPSTSGVPTNISYDDYGTEIEVDNDFFQSPPVTDLAGTGYSDMDIFSGEVCGSSTGWLRTSFEIQPNEGFTLTFSIHDEGDGINDSFVILDNFRWSVGPIYPGTAII